MNLNFKFNFKETYIMKKILPVLLIILLIFSGCSAGKTDVTDNGKLTITATIFPQYDFLREITKGADVQLDMLISPGKEVHGFESTLSDIAKVSESDLFVYVGSEDDKWVEEVPSSGNTRIALTDIITEYEDEHVWTSPKNAIKIVWSLKDALCTLDPENAEIYISNTEKYVSELKELDKGFEEIVSKSENPTIVFAERFPFLNLAKTYGIKHYSAFEGCSTETEAGIKTINFLVEKVKEEKIPAIFTIEFSDAVVAEKISEETGAEVRQFHSCHNVTDEEFENGETYLSLMSENLENLKLALHKNAVGD